MVDWGDVLDAKKVYVNFTQIIWKNKVTFVFLQ